MAQLPKRVWKWLRFQGAKFLLCVFLENPGKRRLTHCTLPCATNAEGSLLSVRRAALWKLPPGAGVWHVCFFGKQKDSEVTQTETWFLEYLKLKWNILLISLLKYKLKMKLSELWVRWLLRNAFLQTSRTDDAEVHYKSQIPLKPVSHLFWKDDDFCTSPGVRKKDSP